MLFNTFSSFQLVSKRVHSLLCYELQVISNGREECILERFFKRRSVCWATKGVSRSSLSGSCVKAEEDIIWLEASTKGLVWSPHHIPIGSWFQERLSRSNSICQKKWGISPCGSSICGWYCLRIPNRSPSSWILRRDEKGVWDEHGGRAKLLSRASSEITGRWDIYLSREICQKSCKEIRPKL